MVTLSGRAPSAEMVSRAIRIAFEIEGVVKVFSTIQIPPVPSSRP
ncbi:MAG: BON domain-containing protein [Verrucomicrobia bacterium]|nr:BON domain-containing protein [Verrucomicrobiota bacterium]